MRSRGLPNSQGLIAILMSYAAGQARQCLLITVDWYRLPSPTFNRDAVYSTNSDVPGEKRDVPNPPWKSSHRGAGLYAIDGSSDDEATASPQRVAFPCHESLATTNPCATISADGTDYSLAIYGIESNQTSNLIHMRDFLIRVQDCQPPRGEEMLSITLGKAQGLGGMFYVTLLPLLLEFPKLSEDDDVDQIFEPVSVAEATEETTADF
ncbi:hypothetical protein BBK36DRAFT_1137482 [Trichoderma citrinoviride]|uniref:Uncharacterized protein n=1 Tax=Trichoderma citrinoviride TaxID=58853 RepID=A0A2T4BNH0_9HYPO|nr:hypothetical protein BBK36DRAFT_1137482 [Trichoderma citrinoviride]PTB70831.1 hypothetical protein BBK36DRAFT_1137482 [Trichoderma citrinoviride]